MADITPNRNYPRLAEDGREPAVDIAQTLYDMITAIDLDVEGISNLLDTVVGGTLLADVAQLQSDVSTLQGVDVTLSGRIDDNDTDIAALQAADVLLQNTKEDAAVRATTTNMTYDGNGNLTLADNGLSRFQNPVYDVENILQSFEQVVNGVTTTVTLSYNGNGEVESIGVA